MSNRTRYLWGHTMVQKLRVTQHIIMEGQTSVPTAEGGILYRDSATGKLKLCADSTNYETVTSA